MSLIQPGADRIRLPYAVMLAIVGIAVGGLSSFLLYSPLISVFDDIVRPIVNLPFNVPIFLEVFLPILLFHSSLMINLREIAEDAAPILVLAIVAVFAAALAIGFGLSLIAGVPLLVALLLGSIVATTDPAAVIAILHEVGAPQRLNRLILCNLFGSGLRGLGVLEQDAGCINLIESAEDGRCLVRLVNYTPAAPLKEGLVLSSLEGLYEQFRRGS